MVEINSVNDTPKQSTFINEQLNTKLISKPIPALLTALLNAVGFEEQKHFMKHPVAAALQNVNDVGQRSSRDIAAQYNSSNVGGRKYNGSDVSVEMLRYDDNLSDVSNDDDNDDIRGDYHQYDMKRDSFEGNSDRNISKRTELQPISRADRSQFSSSFMGDQQSLLKYDTRGGLLGHQSGLSQASRVQEYSSMPIVYEYPVKSRDPGRLINSSEHPHPFKNVPPQGTAAPCADSLPRKIESRKFLQGTVKRSVDKNGHQCRDCKKWFKRRTQLESHARLRKHNIL